MNAFNETRINWLKACSFLLPLILPSVLLVVHATRCVYATNVCSLTIHIGFVSCWCSPMRLSLSLSWEWDGDVPIVSQESCRTGRIRRIKRKRSISKVFQSWSVWLDTHAKGKARGPINWRSIIHSSFVFCCLVSSFLFSLRTTTQKKKMMVMMMMMDNVHLDMRLSIVLIIIDMRRTHIPIILILLRDIDEKTMKNNNNNNMLFVQRLFLLLLTSCSSDKVTDSRDMSRQKVSNLAFVCELLSRLTEIGKSNLIGTLFFLSTLSKRVHAEIDFIRSKMDVLWALSNTHTRVSLLAFPSLSVVHQWRNPISFSICVFTHARTNEGTNEWTRVACLSCG